MIGSELEVAVSFRPYLLLEPPSSAAAQVPLNFIRRAAMALSFRPMPPSSNAPGQIPPNADGSVTVNGNTYRSTLGPNGIPRLSEIPSSGPGGSTSSGIQISLDMTITTGDSKYPVGTDWSLHPKLSFSLCVGTDYGPPQNLPSLGPVIPLHQFACASTPGTNPVKAVISVKP